MSTILVIDDSAEMRRMIRRMLEREGHMTREAGNGKQGLLILEEDSIDLAITDIFMPESNGIEFIKASSTKYPDLPIIAMSGGGQEMPSAVGLSLSQAFGARYTLYKPFNKQELISFVTTILEEKVSQPAAV